MVAVKGVCSRNGLENPRAGFAVFVSNYAVDLNRRGLVPGINPQRKVSVPARCAGLVEEESRFLVQ